MLLIEKIREDFILAGKLKNFIARKLLTTVYAEAMKVGKDARNDKPTNKETIEVIQQFLKNNNEMQQYKKDNNTIMEQTILETYLPKQVESLTEEEIRYVVQETATAFGEPVHLPLIKTVINVVRLAFPDNLDSRAIHQTIATMVKEEKAAQANKAAFPGYVDAKASMASLKESITT